MFEEQPMSPGPEDQLESLLAAEERAIRDEGFSERVVEQAAKGVILRQFAIYGSALAGLGFAVGGIAELTPHLPNFAAWVDAMLQTARNIDVQDTVQGAPESLQFVALALVAGLACLFTAFSLQNR